MLRKVMREVVAAACGQVILHTARAGCQLHRLGALGRVAAQELGGSRGLAGLRSQIDGLVLHAWRQPVNFPYSSIMVERMSSNVAHLRVGHCRYGACADSIAACSTRCRVYL